jgi:hypothetical protein
MRKIYYKHESKQDFADRILKSGALLVTAKTAKPASEHVHTVAVTGRVGRTVSTW